MKGSKRRVLKRALIFSNGEIKDFNFYKKIIAEDDIIICADGGFKHVVCLGVKADYLIGDLDSLVKKEISKLKLEETELLKFPKEKDKTDTQLALEYALNLGVDEIILIGSIGSRLDHVIANIHLLVKCISKGVQISILNEHNEIKLVDDQIEFDAKKGETISLLPLTERVEGITTHGLRYPLDDGTMELGEPYGVSNESTGKKVKIEISSGMLLVMRVRE